MTNQRNSFFLLIQDCCQFLFSTRKWWSHSLLKVHVEHSFNQQRLQRVKKKINSILEGCFSIGWQLAISNLKMSNLELKGKMILISCRRRHGYKSIVAMATVAMATFFFLDDGTPCQ